MVVRLDFISKNDNQLSKSLQCAAGLTAMILFPAVRNQAVNLETLQESVVIRDWNSYGIIPVPEVMLQKLQQSVVIKDCKSYDIIPVPEVMLQKPVKSGGSKDWKC